MKVRFWGTRGSLPKPGPNTLRYGGNTSCVEVTADDGTLVVLDCGTGVHELGQTLLAEGRAKRGSLLISHTHWDHIQGFPFFTPLFIPGTEWDIFAPRGLGHDVAASMAGQMQYRYFPVNLEQLGGTIRYHDLVEGEFTIGSIRVIAHYVNHPAVALGYRLEADGACVVYATDHEPHTKEADKERPAMGAVDRSVHAQDAAHVHFIAGADLLIHDSQYTEAEYAQKVGWGHSPVERVVDYARMGRVKRLALYHHDPLRGDDAVDSLVESCQARAGDEVQVFGAAEGMVIEIQAGQAITAAERPSARREHGGGLRTIMLVDDDSEIRTMIQDLLGQEEYRFVEAEDGESALRVLPTARPDLILLDWHMPGLSGLEVCRAVRQDADQAIADTPVIMLTAMEGQDETRQGFDAGVNDFLTKPFTPAHLRSRVASWLLRHSPAG
jgi:CheY-like chemotaxis protein